MFNFGKKEEVKEEKKQVYPGLFAAQFSAVTCGINGHYKIPYIFLYKCTAYCFSLLSTTRASVLHFSRITLPILFSSMWGFMEIQMLASLS